MRSTSPRVSPRAPGVPGPGAYNPTFPSSTRHVVINPLPRPPTPPEQQDKEAAMQYERKRRQFEEIAERKRRQPAPGSYEIRSTFEDKIKLHSPRHHVSDVVLFGTPRSDRVLLNVDLYESSKLPGPGQYRLYDKGGVGGRDRFYRRRLPMEATNYMSPRLPPVNSSPRRPDGGLANAAALPPL